MKEIPAKQTSAKQTQVTPEKHLYFMAIMPPAELSKQIREIQQDISERFNSKKALNPPVHITLLPPMEAGPWLEKVFNEKMPGFFKEFKSFGITLNGFDCFKPRVIFIKPEENQDLKYLHDIFIKYLRNDLKFKPVNAPTGFNPHVTIAYRDLTPGMFEKAWPEFEGREFKASFDANAVYLLKHIDTKWEVVQEYKLNNA